MEFVQPSFARTHPWYDPALEKVQLRIPEVGPEHPAGAVKLRVTESPSASLPFPTKFLLQGAEQVAPPPVMFMEAVGALLLPVELMLAFVEAQPSLTLTVAVLAPGEDTLQVAVWPLPLAQPLQL